ncbi:MAG: hypothetical protein VW239_11385, partial [Candidatus Nanopelagicales bacterium]
MGGRLQRLLWPILGLPAIVWIVLFFLVPLYVVFCVSFGEVDPIFRTPIPVWNPLEWRFDQVVVVWDRLVGPDNFYLPPVLRTLYYVVIAVVAPAGCVQDSPGGVLRRPLCGPIPSVGSGTSGRAILDFLHDAHAGMDQPVAAGWSRQRCHHDGRRCPARCQLAQRQPLH